jgi:hypothetical protein
MHPEIKESVRMMKTHLSLFICCEIAMFMTTTAKICGSLEWVTLGENNNQLVAVIANLLGLFA